MGLNLKPLGDFLEVRYPYDYICYAIWPAGQCCEYNNKDSPNTLNDKKYLKWISFFWTAVYPYFGMFNKTLNRVNRLHYWKDILLLENFVTNNILSKS